MSTNISHCHIQTTSPTADAVKELALAAQENAKAIQKIAEAIGTASPVYGVYINAVPDQAPNYTVPYFAAPTEDDYDFT